MATASIWRHGIAAFGVVASLVFLPDARGQSDKSVPTVEAITGAMTRAQTDNRARLHSYTVTRDYRFFGEDKEAPPKSQVTADVSFVPPDSKYYAIRQTSGSGLGEKAIRQMLEGEVAIAKDSSADISDANYDFRFIRAENLEGHRCYVLELRPKREAKNLLRGTIWVDANTYLPRRTEGVLAKNPSWWVRNVHIILLYGESGNMWLQTESEATARVRILGQSTVTTRNVGIVVDSIVAAR
jgi:outer membrane lipoprotein-sorting protein